nr:hypothetical protein [uncultured Methanolobus sp.]
MGTKFEIYTEDGKHIKTITAKDIKITADATLLGEFQADGAFEAKAVLPKNWAVIEAQ